MNSIKNAKFISYSQQTYASIIVNLFLHLKWYYPIMSVIFYLKRGFFPHDFTLIASVVGESVIGHGNEIRYSYEFIHTYEFIRGASS